MALLLAYPFGAACVAAWVAARFPALLPGTFRWAAFHFVMSLVLVWRVPRSTAGMVIAGGPAAIVGALLLLVALVYAWIAVAALLRFARLGAPEG